MIILALIVTWINGWAVIECLAPASASDDGAVRWLRRLLAYGVGLVVQGSFTYVSLLATDRLDLSLIGEAALVLGAAATWWKRRAGSRTLAAAPSPGVGSWDRILASAAVLLVGLEVVVDYFLTFRRWQMTPLGYHDNVAQWTGRALFLTAGDERWREVLSPLQTHGDYPLLVPLSIARVLFWSGANEPSLFAPLAVILTLSVATVGIVGFALAARRGAFVGAIGASLLVSTPIFLTWTASLQADIALVFFNAAAVALWATLKPADSAEPGIAATPGALALLGVVLAGSMGCKNEGIVFAAEALVVMGLVGVVQNGFRATVRALAMTLVGLAVAGAAVVHFKAALVSTKTDLVEQWTSDRVWQLFDSSRWSLIAFYTGDLLSKFVRVWMGIVVVLVLLARDVRRPRGAEVCCVLIVPAMTATYLLVYLLSPLDLDWQVRVSLDRILIHLIVLTYFAALLWAGDGLVSRRVVGHALAAFALFWAAWGGYAAARVLPAYPLPAHWLGLHRWMVDLKFHELRDKIPRDARVAFYEEGMSQPNEAFAVARYILAPRVLVIGTDAPWILANHPAPADPAEATRRGEEAAAFAKTHRLVLVADLGNGYRLFRRE